MQAIPIALMAGGALVKGIGAFQAGKYNKAVSEGNASAAEQEGVAEVARIRDAARISMGRQLGAQAESGFAIGTGSAIDSLVESATNAELEAMDARRQAASKAAAYRSQGRLAKMEGDNALIGSLFGAGATVAKGLGDYAQARNG